MTGHYAFAIVVLAYLAIPLLAYLVYWLWKLFHRDGKGTEGEGE